MSDVAQRVQRLVDDLVDGGSEVGIQVAVYLGGELVIDAVAGRTDEAGGDPVGADTLFFALAVGKGMTSALAHILADRGVIDYEMPIVELWPEFGAHGKQHATIRHALIQATAVPGLPADTAPEDLADWAGICAIIADAKPWWEPGTRTGYHALTFGYVVGEIMRRATGSMPHELLRELIAQPLGVADELYFGVPAAQLPRVARVVDPIGEIPPHLADFGTHPDHPMFATAPPALRPSAQLYNRPDFLTCDIPSGGSMTARAIARMYAALLGPVDGVRLVSPATLDRIDTLVTTGVDQIFGVPVPMKFGYGTRRFGPPTVGSPAEFGWSGALGSHADANPRTGMSFAVLKNRYARGDLSTVAQLADIIAELV